MKNMLICGGVVLSLLAAACNNSQPDSVKDASEANKAKVDSIASKSADSAATPSKEDADFLVKAAAGGMLEVELGKMAQSHAQKKGVKDFGAMMAIDHSKGGESIKSLAATKHIILADSISNDQKKMRDDLSKKKGAEFDRSYVSMMVKDHKEDIEEFEKAAKNTNDADIRSFAENTLPMLRHHLDSVQSLDKMMPKQLSDPKVAPANH